MRKWTFAVAIITQLLLYSPFLSVIGYLTLKKLMFLEIVFINQGKAVVRSQNVKYTTLWEVNIAGKSFLKNLP